MIPATADLPYYPQNEWVMPFTFRTGELAQNMTGSTFTFRIKPEDGDEAEIVPTDVDRTDEVLGRIRFTFDLSVYDGPLTLRMRENVVYDDWMFVGRLQQVVG